MMPKQLLFIPDLDRLRRKLASPSSLLGGLLARFQKQVAEDTEFRAGNIHLAALLGDEKAIGESKSIVLREAKTFRARDAEDNAIEHHTWCVAPSVMRLAVYHNWLEHLSGWTEAESQAVAEGLLHFCREHAVSVLRGRAPVADNQSLSLSLCCAVTGCAFRAQALHKFGMDRLALVLGLAPRDGYFGEGSTYQSHVVSPLAMWSSVFLMQTENAAAATRKWPPVGASLLDILCVEALMDSPGSLLPPWDNYGWQPKVNLSPIAYWASLAGRTEALRDAPEIWDRPSSLAWERDDRMWTLIYWPEQSVENRKPNTLSGWSLPQTGAAIDDPVRRARLMLAWDKSSPWLQAIGRAQVNPNHVLYELDGKPIFADGMAQGFLEITPEQIAAPLNPAQRELVAQQYGSIARWANAQHPGLIGAANTVFVDNDIGYFPLTTKHGQLCFEKRPADRHVVTAECVDYFLPQYDLTRARRTIAMNPAGVCWIVDDYRAASRHRFTWQLYLRPGGALSDNLLNLKTSDGQELTLAWISVGPAELDRIESFPERKMAWPDHGSERLRFAMNGDRAQFVVCLLPWRAKTVKIRTAGTDSWRVEWDGGSDAFALSEAAVEKQPEAPEALCDLDHEPFALSDEPDDALLRALEDPDPAAWRRTTLAMQTLAHRRASAAMPAIDRLIRDSRQRYHVHSVAAWCLGRAKHRPSLEFLHYLTNSPETNTALHAQWAVERISSERTKKI